MGMNAYSTQELWTLGIGLNRLYQYQYLEKYLYNKLINKHASILLVINGLFNIFIRNLNS